MTDSSHCWTCGRPRGVAVRRASGSIDLLVPVPCYPGPNSQPCQQYNDMICHAGVYRNGGTNGHTHLCDDCLRLGLRALRAEIDTMLMGAEPT
jgi:hypothetical protein